MKAIALIFGLAVFSNHTAMAGGLGTGFIAADSYFKAKEAAEDREMAAQRHRLDMERQRQQIELQRLQVEAMKRKQAEEDHRKKQESELAADTVQAAIDRNETLRIWQMWNGHQWARSKEVDSMMRALPENADLSLDERFAKVVRFVETEMAMRK